MGLRAGRGTWELGGEGLRAGAKGIRARVGDSELGGWGTWWEPWVREDREPG